MTYLIVGLILFLGVHSVSIVNEPWRDRMSSRLGEMTWKGIYAIVSLVGMVLIVYGYGVARYDPLILYSPPVWLRHVAILFLLPVFPLLLAAYLPGRIQKALKHPMLVAVKLWAFAHLLANGALADLLLFGGFLAWAVAERISLKHRTPRPIIGAPESNKNDIIAVLGGLLVYAVIVLWLHRQLIGVPVL